MITEDRAERYAQAEEERRQILAKAREMHSAEYSIVAIANHFSTPESTVRRWLKEDNK